MSLAIVTRQCFLICEKVVSIVLDEAAKEESEDDSGDYKRQSWSFRKTVAKEKPSEWFIEIKYIPEINGLKTNNPQAYANREGYCNLEIRLSNKQEAFKLYQEIVEEIREQTPDHLYLDKLVEKLLAGEENADGDAEEVR